MARKLQMKYPHLLNPLTFDFLDDAIVEPEWDNDLKMPIFREDTLEYITRRKIHSFDMSKFIRGAFSNKFCRTVKEIPVIQTPAFSEIPKETFPAYKEPTPHFSGVDFTEQSFGPIFPFMSPLSLPQFEAPRKPFMLDEST
ncbi:MAG: hypothetical protein IPK55_10710 [Streptococcus sp.]|nr:hypothetical protein [Streptococcus sp.]